MGIYLLSYFCCYIIGLSRQRRNKLIEYIILFFLVFFLCTGFMCGSDWRVYETMYNSIDFDNFGKNYYAEWGFYIYMSAFKFLDIDFWIFAILTKAVCLLIIIYYLKRCLENDVLLGLMYFVPWYGFYLFIDCPMRNMIAVSIFLLSIQYIIKRNIIKYLILSMIAISFHTTAIVLIPIYFLNKRFSLSFCIIIFLIVNIIFISRDNIINIGLYLFSNIPYIASKIEGYMLGGSVYAEGRDFSWGMLIHLAFFILILCKRKCIEKGRNGILIFNLAIVYLLFYRLAITIEIFMRFQLYASPFFCIALIRIAQTMPLKLKVAYVTYLLCVSSIGSLRIFADSRYIPYTSYIPYMLQGNYPSFEYRSLYNYEHSPYSYKDK